MSSYILEAREVDFSYLDGTKALQNITVKVPLGQKVAFLGNNGAGKTTLFLHFNGVHRPERGRIVYKGQPIQYDRSTLKELRKSIGIVFQDPDNQLFSASVYQDVSFGPLNLGWDEKPVRERTQWALQETGAWELKDKPVHFLSYGQKKRVAIAGVLAMDPEVLILDEPTAGLDPLYTGQMMELLERINNQGKTVVLSSHNMDEVYAWADYVFVIHAGRVLAEGEPQSIFQREDLLEQASLIKPWVLELYQALVDKGKITPTTHSRIPRTRHELLELLG